MKKKNMMIFGLPAVVLAFSLVLAGCDDPNKDSGSSGGPPGGPPVFNGGASWTAVGTTRFTNPINGIAYSGTTFVAVGWNGKIAYSTDGITWSAVTNSTFDTSTDINGVAWGGGDVNKFVAVGAGGKMATSPDVQTWSTVTNTQFSYAINGIAWGNGKFVAVGYGGKMATSDNGTTWAAVTTSTFGTSDIYGITWGGASGAEKFVAVGYDGKMAHSSNGTNWTAVTPGTGAGTGTFDDSNIYGVAYGGGRFVAVGGGNIMEGFTPIGSGKSAYSTDGGTTWTAGGVIVSSVVNFSANGIAYGSGKFVAVGTGGRMAYSN